MDNETVSLRNRVMSGLIWSSIANWGQALIALLVFTVIARVLGPHDLGLYAAVMVVITFIQMFSEQGLSEAIVQSPVVTPQILNAVALLNFGMAVMVVLGVWFAAPLIAGYMGLPEMLAVLRVVIFSVLIAALTFAQQAMLRRNFNYRWLTLCTLTGIVLSGALGIGLAFMGYGVWALAWQTVAAAILTNLMVWSKPQWHFSFEFDFRGAWPLVGFGVKRLLTNLTEIVSTRYVEMLIAATLGAAALGIYAVGVKIYYALMGMVGSSVLNVALNGLSRIAHDRPRFLDAYYRTVGMMTASISAAFVLGACLSSELTLVLFGQKFEASARIMEAVMLWGAIQAVLWCAGMAFMAVGKPAILLWIGIIRTLVMLVVLWWVRGQNLITVVYAFVVVQWITTPIILLLARSLLGISLKRQARVMLPFVVALIGVWVIVAGTRELEYVSGLAAWIRLGVLGAESVLCYGLFIYLVDKSLILKVIDAIRPRSQIA